MTLHFYLNRRDKKFNEQTIFCYIREKGKTIVFSTEESINSKHWDLKNEIAKKSYIGSPDLNDKLQSKKEEIRAKARKYLTENPDGDVLEFLKKEYKQADEKKKSFFEVFEMYIEIRANQLSIGIIKKYNTLLSQLKNFEKITKYNISFESINMLFYDKLTNYFIENMKHSNNTIAKAFDNLRTFLLWATDREFNTNMTFQKFRPKENKVDICVLSEIELMKLFNSKFDSIYLERSKDVFCFECFTGARFSDIENLKRTDIKGNTWHLRTQKTKDVIKIPLSDFALQILEKYKADVKPLPVISSHKFNDNLKIICKKIGLDEPIKIVSYSGSKKIEQVYKKYELVSSHTGRRSFITLSLEKGIRPEVLMQITGHTDFKSFRKYIKIIDVVKENELNKAWNNEPSKLKPIKTIGE